MSGRYLDEMARGLVKQRVLEKVVEGFRLAHDHGKRLHVEVRASPFLHAAVDSWRKKGWCDGVPDGYDLRKRC